MLKLLSAAVVITLPMLAAAPAFAAGSSCQAAISNLMDKWQTVGYQSPQKPAQERVLGSNGEVASGQQVTYMRSQISQAAQECAQGQDSAALTRVAKVSAMLDGQNIRTAGTVAH